MVDLAREIGLSKTPVLMRVKRLEKEGYIQGYRAVLNPEKFNRSHVAFAEVKLSSTRLKALNAFNVAVLDVPEIEQCHMIAGSFDYLLKIRTKDISSYRRVLGEVVSALPYVDATSTHVSMQAIKENAAG